MTAAQQYRILQFSIAQLHVAASCVQTKDRLAALNAIDAANTPLEEVYVELRGDKPAAAAPQLQGHASPEQALLYAGEAK